MGFGSVEGSRRREPRRREIQIGSRNTDTTISGLISEAGQGGQTGGSLEKVGTGTLTLTRREHLATGGTVFPPEHSPVNGSINGTTTVNPERHQGHPGTLNGLVTVEPGGILSFWATAPAR